MVSVFVILAHLSCLSWCTSSTSAIEAKEPGREGRRISDVSVCSVLRIESRHPSDQEQQKEDSDPEEIDLGPTVDQGESTPGSTGSSQAPRGFWASLFRCLGPKHTNN